MTYKIVSKCADCEKVLREREVTEEQFIQAADRGDYMNDRYGDESCHVGEHTITYWNTHCDDCSEWWEEQLADCRW